MLEKFNIIFTGISEEKKLELTQTLNLLGEFCNKVPPLSAHINKALEARFNNIEFIDNSAEGYEYEGVKQFGAVCSFEDKKIIIKAEQNILEIVYSILFELGNAANSALHIAGFKSHYIDEQDYAEAMERNEFKTLVNTYQVILETLKLLENNQTLKQFFPVDKIEENIQYAEQVVNYTFEDHKKKTNYNTHKLYYENQNAYFENPVIQARQLKEFIESKDIDKIKKLLNKINLLKKEHLEYVFNEAFDDSSLEIIKAFLNHPSANDLLKNNLFGMAILMNENKIDVLYKALSQTLEERNIPDFKELSSVKSKKLAEIFYKYSSTIFNKEALSYALKNKDKEFINLILDNIKIKFDSNTLNIICNLKDQNILDKYLHQVDEINMSQFGFNRSWKKWEKDILNKVLESSKNVESEFYLDTVLNYCYPETIDSILKHFTNNEVIKTLFERAVEHEHLPYIEILTKYVGNSDNAETIETEHLQQQALLHNDEIPLIGE